MFEVDSDLPAINPEKSFHEVFKLHVVRQADLDGHAFLPQALSHKFQQRSKWKVEVEGRIEVLARVELRISETIILDFREG